MEHRHGAALGPRRRGARSERSRSGAALGGWSAAAAPGVFLGGLLALAAACGGGTSGPGAPPPPPPPAPPTFSFEDLRSGNIDKILHCSGPLWNPEEHDGYLAGFPTTKSFMVRLGLNLGDTRFTFAETLEKIQDQIDTYSAELPFLSIGFNKKLADGTPVGLDKEVAQGDFDSELTALAGLLKGLNRTVFLRIPPEANGFWNGYSPAFLPDAYRHIVALFQVRGVANAVYVWNVKLVLNQQPPLMDFYPGDAFVDWWSIDLFSPDFLNPTLKGRVTAFLADAAGRGKPVIIPESAPSTLDPDAQSTWDDWFVPYFGLINGDPNVKAFCYSNRDFAKNDVTLTAWGNMRIDQSALKPLYQAELLGSQYQHQP
ncbi:MAG: glycosyl hydrolase [Gemmatimonadota bacterium]